VWLGGSSRGRTTVSIDGRRIGSVQGVLNNIGGFMRFPATMLSAGEHRIAIAYHDGGLRPGSKIEASQPFPLGPFALTRTGEGPRIIAVPVSAWRRLCGTTLDWIEAFAGRDRAPLPGA
jgi:hypothetical protein